MLQMCVQFIHAAPPLLYRKNTQNTQSHPAITTTSNVDTIFFLKVICVWISGMIMHLLHRHCYGKDPFIFE